MKIKGVVTNAKVLYVIIGLLFILFWRSIFIASFADYQSDKYKRKIDKLENKIEINKIEIKSLKEEKVLNEMRLKNYDKLMGW